LAWCRTSSTAQIKTLALLKIHKNCQQREPHSHGKTERISRDNQLPRWRADSKRVIGTNDFQYWSRNNGWKSSNQWRGRCQCD
jgi:tRNA U38,U39,U40 pseudouridine synthase TruA